MIKIIKTGLITLLILLFHDQKAHARPLNICTYLGFEPFVIQKGKSITGIDVEVIVQALTNVKQSANIKAMSWQRMTNALKEGTCDVGFSLFDTEERRDYADYIFSVPIHYSTLNVFVKKNRKVSFDQVTDFFGLKIAHHENFSLTLGLEMAIKDGHIKRLKFDKISKGLKMLESGQIDAIVDNDLRFKYYLKKHKKNGRIRAHNVPFLPHHPAFLVLSKAADIKNREKVKATLETQLKKLRLNGTILDITTKYVN